MSTVSLVQLKNSDLKKAIENSLNLINYNFPNRIKNIAIKPNMCYYWDYSTGQTTNSNYVAALIKLNREKISQDLNISIVESDASAMKCKYAFKFLGYGKLAKSQNVKLVNLSENKGENVAVTVQGENFEFIMPETIKKADLRINVPKKSIWGKQKSPAP